MNSCGMLLDHEMTIPQIRIPDCNMQAVGEIATILQSEQANRGDFPKGGLEVPRGGIQIRKVDSTLES